MSANQPPPPPPQGAYPPPGYYQQPPKKSHTLRNVLLVVLLLFVLFVGGCLALIGGVASEVDKAIQEEEANDVPTDVAEGRAFDHDDFAAEGGWRVSRDGAGGATIEGLRVTNNASTARTALLTFRFYQGNENLAEVECSSNEVQPGEASRLDCFSLSGRFPRGYDTVRVADFF